MTAGFATLTLGSYSAADLRRTTPSTTTSEVREFLIGPENSLVQHSLGLSADDDSSHLEFDCIPLLIRAPSGYGKSHLLQALAATWSREHGTDQVIYTSAADFVNGYAYALKVDDIPQFQRRYRRADLLLVDDLDSIRERQPSQEQLATILDRRLRLNRPTVFAARQPLHALRLTARLTSRISSGLTIPLQLPSSATREMLVTRLCQHRKLELTTAANQTLADQSQLSVPQLMGLINQLAVTGKTKIEETDIRKLLSVHDDDQPDPKAIIRATARYFALPITNLTGTSRRKMDVLARCVAIHLIRELSGLSFQQIGQLFNRRDHTTVMHAYKKTTAKDTDSTTRSAIRELKRSLVAQHGPVETQPGDLHGKTDHKP